VKIIKNKSKGYGHPEIEFFVKIPKQYRHEKLSPISIQIFLRTLNGNEPLSHPISKSGNLPDLRFTQVDRHLPARLPLPQSCRRDHRVLQQEARRIFTVLPRTQHNQYIPDQCRPNPPVPYLPERERTPSSWRSLLLPIGQNFFEVV